MRVFFSAVVLPSFTVLLCFTASPVLAQWDWCWDLDDVYAEVIASTIRVHHDATLYNCCPERFDYAVSQQGNVIRIEETEINPQCACMCCYDLSVDVEDVPPGSYVVEFRWWDTEAGDWLSVPLEVTVPDVGQAGPLVLGPSAMSDCLTVGIPEPNASSTWGSIKALYR